MREKDYEKKPIFKRGWFILLCILLIAYGVSNSQKKKTENVTSNATMQTTVQTSTQKKYKTETDIAAGISYAFAVEVPGYQYDNFQSGTYTFGIKSALTKSASETKNGKAVVPQVFDIYISDKDYKSKYEMASSGLQPAFSVGGMNGGSVKVTLEPNKYVYVVPVKSDTVDYSGILHVKLTNK